MKAHISRWRVPRPIKSSMEEGIGRVLRARTHFEVLGVDKTASADEIRKSYLKMSLKFHPDRCKHPSATTVFQKISDAYSVLSDPSSRSEYERNLRFGTAGGSQSSSSGHWSSSGTTGMNFEAAAAMFRSVVEEMFRNQRAQNKQSTGAGASAPPPPPSSKGASNAAGAGLGAGAAGLTAAELWAHAEHVLKMIEENEVDLARASSQAATGMYGASALFAGASLLFGKDSETRDTLEKFSSASRTAGNVLTAASAFAAVLGYTGAPDKKDEDEKNKGARK